MLLSGGADSVCLLEVCLRLGARVSALHVNYGLREGAAGDEALCRELCERLEVPLAVEHVALGAAGPGGAPARPGAPAPTEPAGTGNLQAEAREARYRLAAALAGELGADYATAHTASDQAETVIYRLATSPGRRALLGMPPRRGRVVRPLLAVTREETRAYCEARGFGWRDDPSNADPRFARARVRHEVLSVLGELSPAAERTIAETALLLRDEQEVLDRAVEEALERTGEGAVALAELDRLPPGLARLVLRRLAEAAAGAQRPLSRAAADAVLALGGRGGTRSLDLGGGLRAVVEYGTLRFTTAADASDEGRAAVPEPVALPVPGSARFGAWRVEARAVAPGEMADESEEALLRADELGPAPIVRAWRAGDRIRPAGLGGSKSLQDLFVDRKVPRALRSSLPVVEAGGEIAWVAGLAVGERFAPTGAPDERRVALAARAAGG